MKNLLCAALLCVGLPIFAQNGEGPQIKDFYIETRMGYEAVVNDGTVDKDNSGFRGQWLNMRLDGQIVKGLTFSFRHRMNKNTERKFFDATDWVHLDWQAFSRLSFSVGKQVVGIGGYEYDRAPIDLYYCSEFWNNIGCYQYGVSATYSVSPDDNLTLQGCTSPLRGFSGDNGTHAVNLMWNGHHGIWNTIWSVNMSEYERGKWINYIALGNKFCFTDRWALELDYMNRASSHQKTFFDDFSIMAEMCYKTTAGLRCYAKYTYDQNMSGTKADQTVIDGTQIHHASIGIEGHPLKQYREHLRLFAFAGYSWGKNTNPEGTRLDRQLLVQGGVKFRLDIMEGIRRIVKK